MTHGEYEQLFDRFNSLSVLIVGDIMLDAYLWGNVERISPEAPVPVVHVKKREYRLGGAGNVALNIMAMGATPILCTVIGHDENGTRLKQLFEKRGFTTEGVVESDRQTTCKTRVIGGNQQIIRVDEEETDNISTELAYQVISRIESILNERHIDVVILQDYNKGLFDENLIQRVIQLSADKNIPVTVDPKYANFFAYNGVTLFKPNVKELADGLKMDLNVADTNQMENAVMEVHKQLHNKYTLVTLSERGVLISDGNQIEIIPAHVRTISDVSGAGDSVISVAALGLACEMPPSDMAALANLAGGQVCEKVGVVPVNKEQLLKELVPLVPSS